MRYNDVPPRERLFRSIRYIALMIATAVLFPAIAMAAPPSPLDPASPAARSIANLHTILLWFATVVFLIVCALLLYSIVRFRRKSEDDPEPDQSFHGNALLETIWTIVPVGILLVLLVFTFQTFQDTDIANSNDDLIIKVTGKQWLWEVEYISLDRSIKLTNEMRVPLNADVRIELEGADVLHSFWVPQLGGKVDVVPGYKTETWFRAERLGTFYGQCAEYCGLGHAAMPMEVTVLTPNSFDLWASATADQQANAGAQGELLFASNCSSCHVVNGEGGQIGPELTNIYAEEGEEYVRESILLPNAVIATLCPTGACQAGIMPQNFGEILTEADLDNIVTYLREASGVEEASVIE